MNRKTLFFALILLLGGCSTSGSDSSQSQDKQKIYENVSEEIIELEDEEEAVAAPALKYPDDLSIYVQMMESAFLSEAGPFDFEVETSEISGPEAWQLLEGHRLAEPFGESFNKAFAAVLHDPTSSAFYMKGRFDDAPPIEAILIPWPEPDGEYADLIRAQEGPGAFLYFGVESTGELDSAEERGQDWELTTLTYEKLEELRQENKNFIVAFHAEGCGASAQLMDIYAALELGDDVPLFAVETWEVFGDMDGQFRTLGYPSLIGFEGDRWVDIYIGTSSRPLEQSLLHFLTRQEMAQGPNEPFIGSDSFSSEETMRRTLSIFNDWSSLSLRGEDLQNIRLVRGSLAGSDLRDANLQGANLSHAYIARSRFKGANLDDVTLEGAQLYEVECVDGRVHSGGPEGCLSELDE